jgi:predicted PurR-regulated permease PerM
MIKLANSPSKEGLAKLTYILVSMVAIFIILIYTEEYAITFIIALIIWFIIHELRENLQMVPWIRDNFPIWLQSTIAFFVISLVIVGILDMIYYNVSILYESIDKYLANFQIVLLKLNKTIGLDVAAQVNEYLKNFDSIALAESTLDYTSSLIGNGFLIILYVVFLLVEETIFPLKLKAFYPDEEQQAKKQALFYKMDQNIGRYLKLKTLVSFITGALSYIVLLIFGIESAFFWAFLIFVLNFIPTVGSLIATIFPALFAVLQMAEIAPFFYILVLVGSIQVLVGNVLEPKLMGNSLNMSALVVVLSLTLWGAIWGVMGMILSVPITVMMIIVFEEIPSLRFIAVALSEKGDLDKPVSKPIPKK